MQSSIIGASHASRTSAGSPSEPVSAFVIIVIALAFLLAMLLVILLASTPSAGQSFSFYLFLFGGLLLPALHQCDPDCL